MRLVISTIALFALAATAAHSQISFPPDIRVADIVSGDLAILPPQSAREVCMSDFNGDGILDLFVVSGGVTSFTNQLNSLYWGLGDGSFTRSIGGQTLVTDNNDSRGVAIGDFDMDGDMDIYVANSNAEHNSLYLNQTAQGSAGVFTKVVGDPSTADTKNSRQAEVADVDGDGDLDLFVTNWNNQTNDLFFNTTANGGGPTLFVKATQFQAGDAVTDAFYSFGATFGDIDNDGDVDLFVANHSGITQVPMAPPTGAKNSLYFNNGQGFFTKSLGRPPVVDVRNSLSCCFGDMDGDGDLDLFVGNVQYQANCVFRNLGDGTFQQEFYKSVAQDRSHTIDCHWVDVNGDGRNELLLANRAGLPYQEFDSLYFVEGNKFRRQAFGPLGVTTTLNDDTYSYAVGDFDNDGDPDMVGINFDTVPYVFRNDGRMWDSLAPIADAGVEQSSSGYFMTTGVTRLSVAGATPNRPAGLVAQLGSITPVPTPFMGITLLASPVNPPSSSLALMTNTDANGEINLQMHFNMPVISDFGMLFQWIVLDSENPSVLSATNGLTAITP